MSYKNFSEYIECIRKAISQFMNMIISYNIDVNEVTKFEGFIRGRIIFIDGSTLEIFEYIVIDSSGVLRKLKYRYHYMNAKNKTIFRYDNAPHPSGLSSFPHHKHISNGLWFLLRNHH